ncbi:hypothetical protein IWX50DRAFT_621753 [Phyllosticta citricarpa]|uniref:Uncharacterized protein n=1 Tax=Phyllosticta citricarpa TaxID=55181 RepID=A0ABR1MPC4_9PEZI
MWFRGEQTANSTIHPTKTSNSGWHHHLVLSRCAFFYLFPISFLSPIFFFSPSPCWMFYIFHFFSPVAFHHHFLQLLARRFAFSSATSLSLSHSSPNFPQ